MILTDDGIGVNGHLGGVSTKKDPAASRARPAVAGDDAPADLTVDRIREIDSSAFTGRGVNRVVSDTAAPHAHATALAPDSATTRLALRVDGIDLDGAAGDLHLAVFEVKTAATYDCGGVTADRIARDR